MPWKILQIIVVVSLCTLVAFSQGKSTNEASKAFDELFKKRIEQVQGTPSVSDDIELAKMLLKVGRDSRDQTPLLILLTESAFELAIQSREGYLIAVDAMGLLRDEVPAKRDEAGEKYFDVLNRLFVTSTGVDRDALGRRLASELLEDGDRFANDLLLDKALGRYRKAMVIASRGRLENGPKIKARIQWAVGRQRTAKRIEQLQQMLLRDASDTDSAKSLSLIFLNEYFDPEKASKYAGRASDAGIVKISELVRKPIEKLTISELFELGQWYQDLADSFRGADRVLPLMRAENYFLVARYATTDTLMQTKLNVFLDEIRVALKKLPSWGGPNWKRHGMPKPVPHENVKVAFALLDGWSMKDEAIIGRCGNIDGAQPHLVTPFFAREFRFGLKMKSKWYQTMFFTFRDRGNVSIICSVGNWSNQATLIRSDLATKKVDGRVTSPDEWNDIEVRLTSKSAIFYYNQRELGKYEFKQALSKPERFTVGFGTHETTIQIKDVYLVIDGKVQAKLPTPD